MIPDAYFVDRLPPVTVEGYLVYVFFFSFECWLLLTMPRHLTVKSHFVCHVITSFMIS